jgi:peptidoglycan/xylan/chitin deacetylase (PgdA/CDA1 family)
MTVGEIGNHTWSHPHLLALSAADTRNELVWAEHEIVRALGVTPMLFRPPYAEANAADDGLARRLNLLDVRWSADSGDSRLGATPHSVAQAAIAALRPGAIILLHDPHPTTAAVARAVLRAAKRKRLHSVTVSTLLARQPPSAAQLVGAGESRCR